MNHIYKTVFNASLGTWIAVSDLARGKHKTSTTKQKSFNYCTKIAKTILLPPLFAFHSNAYALPTGNQLNAGQATVTTPTATQLQINQSSDKAVINWQTFSVGQNEAVHIQQPNQHSALLNRVVGQNASDIQGKIQANGQIYLINPNGIVFGKTAQVDVGGIIATTHDIKNDDFLNGKNHFSQNRQGSKIENHGTINGGVVALISEQVNNTGTINTAKGTTVLAAGKTVDLDFKGDGLVEVKVTEAALNAQIQQQGAINANGGRVLLSAKSANALMDTVINQQGIIKAQGLFERNGEIVLDGGDSGITQVSGTVNASGQHGGKVIITGANVRLTSTAAVEVFGQQNGGHVVIGDKQSTQLTTLAQGSTIDVSSLENGNAGQVDVFANMQDGTVNAAGQIEASALKRGNGGFIETSAAHVKVANTARMRTKAVQGQSGTWLIDPNDFTIAAIGGDISGATLSANLNGASVNITSVSGGKAGNGDIFVNDVVNWSVNKLTLTAERNININANLNGSGTAQLALQYDQANLSGDYFINKGVKVNLPKGLNFSTKKGPTAPTINYQVITELGLQNSVTTTDLQGINGNLTMNYALGADIDASPTSTAAWNLSGTGFNPIGLATPFSGRFEGLGHKVSDLSINLPASDFVGLFSQTSSTISNVELSKGSVIGRDYVGGLVGKLVSGAINNSSASTNVIGSNYVGGLVGFNFGGEINQVYATGNVTGTGTVGRVGGLVGWNNVNITQSYATGNVDGINYVGGLCGLCNGSIVANVYATGNVTGNTNVGGLAGYAITLDNTYSTGKVTGTTNVGGLVGEFGYGSINNSFWDKETSFQNSGVGLYSNGAIVGGVTGLTTNQIKQSATFTGWAISNTGGSNATWRIYDGYTAPLLRHWLTPLMITASSISKIYNGLADSALNASYSAPNVASSKNLFNINDPYNGAKNVGSYAMVNMPYSNQQGYDIFFSSLGNTLTILPATLTVTPSTQTIVYGTPPSAFTANITGFVNGENASTAGVTGTALFNINNFSGDVGSYNINYTEGLSSQNYVFLDNLASNNELNVLPAILWVTPNLQRILYGTKPQAFLPRFTGFKNGENVLSAGITGKANFKIHDFMGGIGRYNVSYLDGLSSRNYIFVDNFLSFDELIVRNPIIEQVFQTQSTPLQTSVTYSVRAENKPERKHLVDTENEGVKLPHKLHQIIRLFLRCTS